MPELPEIENVKSQITHLNNKTITNVIVRNGDLRYKINQDITQDLINKTVIAIHRRAKYLVLDLNQGHLIVHLGMSGSITLLDVTDANNLLKHDHIDIIFDNNIIFRFNDPRRFGCVLYVDQYSKHEIFKDLGVEPLTDEFDEEYLFNRLHQKRTSIKQLIMDNSIVVGIGNIYASEALFLAKISPFRHGKSILKAEVKTLVSNIKILLKKAIKEGGSTLKDYKHTDGGHGEFQNLHLVYDKNGTPCKICNDIITAKRLGQRNSFYCPTCQS